MVFVTILAHVNVSKTRKARTDLLTTASTSARQKMVLFAMGTVHAASATMEQYAIVMQGGLDRHAVALMARRLRPRAKTANVMLKALAIVTKMTSKASGQVNSAINVN